MSTVEEIRARLEEAMNVRGDFWLDEAVRQLEAYRALNERLRVYDISTVGARIRTAREIRGWTQWQLAARLSTREKKVLGINVSNWETGNTDCPARYFEHICQCLAVSPAWVLGESEDGGPPCPKSGVMRRQFIPNYSARSRKEKKKVRNKVELARLRGLLPPRPPETNATEP